MAETREPIGCAGTVAVVVAVVVGLVWLYGWLRQDDGSSSNPCAELTEPAAQDACYEQEFERQQQNAP
jgi:hypothetical protein